ncbi:YfhO family protein [bacterium]|nr:YfhO family protein [bacterium]
MSKSKSILVNFTSFFIPIIIILLSCIPSRIFPFGNNEFMLSDCCIEYVHFISYLKHALLSNDNLIYSLSNTGGNEMMSFSSYYISSPLNLITLLFPNSLINVAMQCIMILKLALCGLFFAIFLNRVYGVRYANILFAVTYALSSYNLMNISNLMFFDGIALLPLTILGIYDIVKNKKCLIYIFALALTIITNSFIGYIVILFSMFFFIYLMLMKKYIEGIDNSEIISKVKTYIFSTAVALGLTSFILVPLQLSLTGTKYSFFNLTGGLFEIRANILEIFTKFLTGSFEINEFISAPTPHLFIGIFGIILVVLYFLNTNILKKERIITGAFFLFLFCGFIINILFTMWNMGVEHPGGTIFRFGFIFEFFIVYLAYNAFLHINSITKQNLIITNLILIVLFVNAFCNRNILASVHLNFLILDIILFILFSVFLFLLVGENFNKNRKFYILFALIFALHSINLVVNTEFSISSQKRFHFSQYNDTFSKYYQKVNSALDYIYSIDDKNFLYRIETNLNNLDRLPNLATYLNAAFTFGYSSVSGHTSTSDNDKAMFYYYIGMPTKNEVYNITYTVDTMNFPLSLMGVKYIISKEEINRPPYKLLKSISSGNENTYIYANEYAFPVAFITDDEPIKNKVNFYDLFDYPNNLIKNILNVDFGDIYNYVILEPKASDWDEIKNNEFEIQLISDNIEYDNAYVYFDVIKQEKIDDDTFEKFIIKNGDYKRGIIYTELQHNSFYLDNIDKNSPIYLYLKDTSTLDKVLFFTRFFLVNENLDILKKYYEKASEQALKLEKITGSHYSIKCKVNENNKILFTTIPYNKNWRIKIDGQSTEYYSVADALLAIPVEEGEHIVDIQYRPKGFNLGIIISLLSLLILLIYIKRNKMTINS